MSTSPDDELQADVVDESPSPQPVDIDLADLQLVDEVDDEANSVDDEELDDLDDDGLLEEDEVQGDIPDEPEPHELEDGMENGLTADVPDIMDSERPSVSPDSVKEDETDDEEQEEEEEDASQKDEVQILSPSKSKLIGTPGRFRRSGEHQPEEKALAALACRLPTNLEIREGHAFQVFVPDFEEHTQEVHETGREKCIWKPMKEADPELIEEYCNFCNARYGMHRDRALFILRLANYDFEKAKQKCEIRTVIDDDWDDNDIWLFNHCIANFGKNFTKIRNVMPHKSASALVQHYYNTKKNQCYKSCFDVDHILMNEDSPVDNADDDEEGSKGVQSSEGKEPDVATEEAEENVTTEEDGEDVATRRESTPLNFSRDANGESDEEIICSNCQEYVNKIHDVDELKLCSTCFYYLKATNTMRPSRELTSRKKIKLPADMVGIVAGFHNSARKIEEPMYDIEGDEDDEVRVYSKCTFAVDGELLAVQKEVQELRGKVSREHLAATENFTFKSAEQEVDKYRKLASTSVVPQVPETEEWTEREMTIAFHALVLCDKDCVRAAKLLRTKNAEQIKEFAERHAEDLDEAVATVDAMESTSEAIEEAIEEVPDVDAPIESGRESGSSATGSEDVPSVPSENGQPDEAPSPSCPERQSPTDDDDVK